MQKLRHHINIQEFFRSKKYFIQYTPRTPFFDAQDSSVKSEADE